MEASSGRRTKSKQSKKVKREKSRPEEEKNALSLEVIKKRHKTSAKQEPKNDDALIRTTLSLIRIYRESKQKDPAKMQIIISNLKQIKSPENAIQETVLQDASKTKEQIIKAIKQKMKDYSWLMLANLLESANTRPDTEKLRNRDVNETYYETASIEPGCVLGLSNGRIGYKHHVVVTNVDKETKTFDAIHVTGDFEDVILGSTKCTNKASAQMRRFNASDVGKMIYIYDFKQEAFENNMVVQRSEIVFCIHEDIVKNYAKYNVLKNNCHHFASYIATGQFFSRKLGRCCCTCIVDYEINDALREKVNNSIQDFILQIVEEKFEKAQENYHHY